MKRSKPKSKIPQSNLPKSAEKFNAIDIRPPFELPEGDGRIYNGAGQLSVRYHPGPKGQLIIEPYDGEIDIYTAPSLRELFIDAINNGHIHLIINLDSVKFLDSTGLGVLLGGLRRVRSRDGYLDLVCSQERILKIFRITGHTKIHNIFPSIQEALAARSSNTHIDVAPERTGQELAAGDWIPVRLYLTEAQHHEQIEAALRVLIEEFGLEVNYEFPPFYGSYWREFGTRFRKRTTSITEVDRHMAALERSMRVHIADQRQSASNENEAKAIAEFITALHHTSNAVIQIGTVILIKVDGMIVTRNLSPLELIYYQRDPSSFKDPKAALRTLQAIAALKSGQAHGRHPKTRTIHLAQAVPPPSNESDGELVLFAQCGRTSTPLILETDSTISCGSCRNIALHRSSPPRP